MIGIVAAIALIFDADDTCDADWRTAILNIGLGTTFGVLMVVSNQAGLFRGCLLASVHPVGKSHKEVLVTTSRDFKLWHVSAIDLNADFDTPAG